MLATYSQMVRENLYVCVYLYMKERLHKRQRIVQKRWPCFNKWRTWVKDIREFFMQSCFLKLNLGEVCFRVH